MERYLLSDGKMHVSEVGNWVTRAEADAELEEANKLVNKYAYERDRAKQERDDAERRCEDAKARAESLEAEIDAIRKAMGGHPDSDLVSLATTLKARDAVAESLEAENRRLREALEFYAARHNYTYGDYGSHVIHDHGNRARKALERREGE